MGEVVPIHGQRTSRFIEQLQEEVRQYPPVGRLAWLHMLAANCEAAGWMISVHRLSLSLGMEVYFYPPGCGDRGSEHILLDHNANLEGSNRVQSLELLLPHWRHTCGLLRQVCDGGF